MRGFVQTSVGRYEERDLPLPAAGPGEVVLRMRATLTCGTDLKILTRGHPADPAASDDGPRGRRRDRLLGRG